ncbi:MAG: squalene--hopene cyclase [Planctomycetes bacterium]|nr:squalene--hopene cyclase [Planctomycetota bacterium]
MSTGSFVNGPSRSTGDATLSGSVVAMDLSLRAHVEDALAGAVDELIRQQAPDGYWCAELEGDSILQSEYILLSWIVEREKDPRLPKIANYLRKQQRESDGAWIQYPGAKPDLSATVKAYFALKLIGDDVNAPHMVKARELIHTLGGAEKCNTYSKFYLAALGQMHYDNVPAVPPEMVLLPRWFYFHLDKVSAWSRTMIMPLSIVSSYRPVRQLPEPMGIMELYTSHDYRHRPVLELDQRLISWRNLFVAVDKGLKILEKIKLTPLRRKALKQIEEWILERTNHSHSDGLGAIFPPMVYIIIAFRCLGYDMNDPHVGRAYEQLDRLMIEDGDEIRFQPCFSPIWDSGIAAYALTEAGLKASHPAVKKVCDWLVAKECRDVVGDWKNNVRRDVPPSGWYFEFNNAYYPDVDDTAMVAMALHRAANGSAPEAAAAAKRGVNWILAMQNEDGGWAAFDRTISRPILEHIPFADHNAIQDPSCPDITGRTLECLGHHGFDPSHPVVQKAVKFLQFEQEPEGCWFGRWGVNYIYGTWQVVGGLRTVGVDMNQEWIQRAGKWLRGVQKPDGSFGESADSYEDPTLKGEGPSTASQTAWGAMAMMAVYGPQDAGVQRAIRWLTETQLPSGTWDEKWFTGTGFPRVFYLRYHLYRLYFPIMCMGRWKRAIEAV